MSITTKEWIHKTVDQLKDRETEQLKDYLEFLTWKSKQQKPEPKQTGKNPIAQRIIKAMKEPPHLTEEDAVDAVPKLIQKLNPMELTRSRQAAETLGKIHTPEALQAVEEWERKRGRRF